MLFAALRGSTDDPKGGSLAALIAAAIGTSIDAMVGVSLHFFR
jgi:hypothetical protein